MSLREELEAALHASWSTDTLSVYADHLLSLGEPRGELIALDLAPAPADRAWWNRRRAALDAWLGHDLAARAGHLVQHGFIHELRDGYYPRDLLDTPLGPLVRGYTAWGRGRATAALAALAARPRPHLARLAIAHWGRSEPLDGALVKRLIDATPRLTELVLIGRPLVEDFPHPALRRVAASGGNEIISDRISLAAVTAARDASGPALADEDILLVLELVDAARDVNDLYAHTVQLPEPLPALVTRLAAAGLVELEGPIARVALSDRGLHGDHGAAPRARSWGRQLHVGVDLEDVLEVPWVSGLLPLLRACMIRFPLSGANREVLGRFLEMMQHGGGSLDTDRIRPIARALACLHELHGLWPDAIEIHDDSPWLDLERLVTLLTGPGARKDATFGLDFYD
jgi:hypothetical protein